MPTWLLVEAQLRFSPSLKPIFPQKYCGDLLPEGGDLYYGVHFASAPTEIKPGEQLFVDLLVRAFPKDPCAAFQSGQKVFLKEGSLVRAEGTITRRWEYESASTNVASVLAELAEAGTNSQ